VNNNFFKNHVSQIETVSVIVHTPITLLFKGAQLMNYAVWVLILLCCPATKCPVRQCFYALFTLQTAKLKQVWVFFYNLFTQIEEKKISIACFSFRFCWNLFMSAVFAQEICYLNLKEWKRMSNRRQDSVGNLSWNQCLLFCLQE